MRAKILLATLFLLAGQAFGQFIQITGTVQDNIGLPYANGTIVPVLNISGSPTLNGQPYTPPSQPFGLDANGKFAFNLAANNQLRPTGSTWSFIVCSGPGTVSIAWGRQSECFNVNTLTLNTAQDITRQIMTQAQPLTYSSSVLLAANPSNCPLLDGLVDFNFSVRDASGRASVQVAALGSQNAIGFAVFVPGAQCQGVTQVATGLVVPCKTDGQSVIGDFVTSSSTTAGECNDYGSVLSSTTKTYGQVIAANSGAGTVSMIFISGTAGGGGGGGGNVGNCPINGGVGWYQFAGNIIGCNVNLTADAAGDLTALSYSLTGPGTLTITSDTYSSGLPGVCAAGSTCLSFDTNGILNGSVNGGAWFPYLTTLAVNCSLPYVCVGGPAAGDVGNGTMTDDLTAPVTSRHGLNVRTAGAYSVEISSNGTTGVGQYLTACDDGSGKVLTCNHTTSTTNVPAGIVLACNNGATPPNAQACGTTGNAIVSGYGFLTVFFDNVATALHYAQQSTTTDGYLHDVGATVPTNGQPWYFIWVSNTGANTTGVIRILNGDEIMASGGGGPPNRIQVNGANSARTSNFVDSATVTWNLSNSGNTGTITANVASGMPGAAKLSNPSAPTCTAQGATGSTAYNYLVIGCEDAACSYHSAASSSCVAAISNGNATLSTSNYNQITAYGDTLYGYRGFIVCRTAGGASQGIITGAAPLLLADKKFNDTGLTGDGSNCASLYASNTTLKYDFCIGYSLPGNPSVPGSCGVDVPPLSPNAMDDEMSATFGAPADVNNPIWSWVNQQSGTATWTSGLLTITKPGEAGPNFTFLGRPLPATPWTFVAHLDVSGNGNYAQCFFGLEETATNKSAGIGLFIASDANTSTLGFKAFTSLTSEGASSFIKPVPAGYYKIHGDGTNITYSWSPDGIVYSDFITRTWTNDFTTGPNSIGVIMDSYGSVPHCDLDYFRRTQ